MRNYPNLEALADGCASGRISEWPMLKVEARAVLDELAMLRQERRVSAIKFLASVVYPTQPEARAILEREMLERKD